MKGSLKWVIVAVLVYLAGRVHFGISAQHDSIQNWTVSLLLALIFALAMLEIGWSKRAFQQLEPVMIRLLPRHRERAVSRWYGGWVRHMYNVPRSVLTGLAFSPLIIGVALLTGWNSWILDGPLRAFETISHFLLLSAAATSQWPFSRISYFAAQLPQKGLSVDFFAHPSDNIMAIGSLFLKIVLGGVGLTSMLALCILSSPMTPPGPIYVLFISVYIWAGIWFFVTQYSIHECMREQKRGTLVEVSQRLMDALRHVSSDPSSQQRTAFAELKTLHESLCTLPEWPFRRETVLTLLTSVIVPVAVTLLQLLAD